MSATRAIFMANFNITFNIDFFFFSFSFLKKTKSIQSIVLPLASFIYKKLHRFHK